MSLKICLALMIACGVALCSITACGEPGPIKGNHDGDFSSSTIASEETVSNCSPETIKGNVTATCFAHNINVRLVPDEGDATNGTLVDFTDGSMTIAGADVVQAFDGESASYWFGPHASPNFLVTDTTAQIRFGENASSVTFQIQNAPNVTDVPVGQMLLLDYTGMVVGETKVFLANPDASGSQAVTIDLHANRPFRSILFQNTSPLLLGNVRYQLCEKQWQNMDTERSDSSGCDAVIVR